MTQPVNTPLGINVLGSLVQNQGFKPNSDFESLIGTSTALGNYTAGSILTNCAPIQKISAAINSAATLIGNTPLTTVSAGTFNNLINLGSGLPALANSADSAQDYVIAITSTTAAGTLTATTTDYFSVNSPIYFTGTLDPALSANTVYWVRTIDSGTAFTVSATVGGAVVPLTGGVYNMNAVSVIWQSWGWLGKLAMQSYKNWSYNQNQTGFTATFTNANSWCNSQNSVIWATSSSVDYLSGTYSNINDLITADISGVNLSLPQFGQDLIASGRAIDLSTIQSFGLPSNLLLTLKSNRAQTASVNLALLSVGLSAPEIKNLTNSPADTTLDQQRKILEAFKLIEGTELAEILLLLNCRLSTITTLADLLDPRLLFPLSYRSLSVPVWNTEANPTNSKTYYPIYVGNGVNTQLSGTNISAQAGYIVPNNINASALYQPGSPEFRELQPGFDSYLRDILPADQAMACGAVAYSMMQITGIQTIEIQKFAQVVANLEVTKDLPLTAGTSVPVDNSMAAAAMNAIALGTGPRGTYTLADFFGSVSGTNYKLNDIAEQLNQLDTQNLELLYDQMLAILAAPPSPAGYDADLAPVITAANLEIAQLASINSVLTDSANTAWSQANKALAVEISTRIRALRNFSIAEVAVSPDTEIGFINQLAQYATSTDPNMSAQTLEQLSDTAIVGGQSVIALMRMLRNQARLDLIGVPLNTYIPAAPTRTERALLIANDPANTEAQQLGKIENDKYTVTNTQYQAPRVVLDGSAVPGSFGGSPYTKLIPPELNTLYTSSQLKSSTYSVPEAVTEVERCNCTCWSP